MIVDDREPPAPADNLPVYVSREGLKVHANKLNMEDEDPVPPDTQTPGAPTRIATAKSIGEDVLSQPPHASTPEDAFVIRCSPCSLIKLAMRRLSTLCGPGNCSARLWDDLFTETPSHVLSGHKGWVLNLATDGHAGHVRLWHPKTEKPRARVSVGGHTVSVNVVLWGRGGLIGKGVLYTASSDRTTRVWDANEESCLHILKNHAHWVTILVSKTSTDSEAQSLALARCHTLVSAAGELLIPDSDDHTLHPWSLFPSQTVSSDASSAVFGRGGKLKHRTRFPGYERHVAQGAFSRCGVSAAWDDSARIHDRGPQNIQAYDRTTDLPGHTDEVYYVHAVADKLVSGGRNTPFYLWEN
ncbi:hypothetical protein K466DRAFT_574037 [Polyporus arcularius HHB13444]|uniref:Uncharacterized protein n=1 Tax=Polyporus arcularius HHB13444 TaxID=1314778 RepID=A0A5C3PXL8_9APHY|nr:hypothetical protein K466DRAFT_574037 [Polyporus arcularius HHB13444]